jgi:hypothetical protein
MRMDVERAWEYFARMGKGCIALEYTVRYCLVKFRVLTQAFQAFERLYKSVIGKLTHSKTQPCRAL